MKEEIRVTETKSSSSVLGNCERCDKYSSEIFIERTIKHKFIPEINRLIKAHQPAVFCCEKCLNK